MTKLDQLPHLLELLDDESPKVRSAVAQELLRIGPARLEEELDNRPALADGRRRRTLERVLGDERRRQLEAEWRLWQQRTQDHARLEAGLSAISDFLDDRGEEHKGGLGALLDTWAEDYLLQHGRSDVRQLSVYLFQERGLWGDQEDYYRPENSSPVHVLREGRGLPLSLACIYMLVGDRIGVDIGGCNLPGHFLARVFHEGQIMLVDCFRGGYFIDEDVLIRQHPGAAGMIRKLIRQDVPAETIIDRTLRNLLHAFTKAERAEDAALMRRLVGRMPETANGLPQLRAQDFSEGGLFARFELGELVRHKRYGYRGVVVERDDRCQADDEWYYSNQTQPDRDQPWYHVLVDGSERITYAAETSLVEDELRRPVAHPLVPVFFEDFDGSRYQRNDQPWPGHG